MLKVEESRKHSMRAGFGRREETVRNGVTWHR